MKRIDWLERLWETLEAHRALPFRWAGRDDSHDCCTFAAACVDAMTGSSHVDALLTHYVDCPTALRYIADSGGLAATISSYLGEPKPLGFMGRGDVAVINEGGTELVGVCVGDFVICATEAGLGQHPRALAVTAWGI